MLLDLDTFSFAFLSLGSHNGEMFVTCIRFKLGRTKRVLSALTFRFVPLRNPFVRWWRGSIKLDWWNYTFGINLCREEEDWCSWRTIRLGSIRDCFGFFSNLYFFDIFRQLSDFNLILFITAATQFDWKWLQWSFSFPLRAIKILCRCIYTAC